MRLLFPGPEQHACNARALLAGRRNIRGSPASVLLSSRDSQEGLKMRVCLQEKTGVSNHDQAGFGLGGESFQGVARARTLLAISTSFLVQAMTASL
jgi:hypothetical protein